MNDLDVFLDHVEAIVFGYMEGDPFVTWLGLKEDEPKGPEVEDIKKHFNCLAEMWEDRCLTYVDSHMFDRGFVPCFQVVYQPEMTELEIEMGDVCINKNIYSDSDSDEEKLEKRLVDENENVQTEVRDLCSKFLEEDFEGYMCHLKTQRAS